MPCCVEHRIWHAAPYLHCQTSQSTCSAFCLLATHAISCRPPRAQAIAKCAADYDQFYKPELEARKAEKAARDTARQAADMARLRSDMAGASLGGHSGGKAPSREAVGLPPRRQGAGGEGSEGGSDEYDDGGDVDLDELE